MMVVLVSFVFFRAQNSSVAIDFLFIMFNPLEIEIPHWVNSVLINLNLDYSYLPFFSSGSFTLKFLFVTFFLFLLSILIPNVADRNFKFNYNWKNSLLLSTLILLSFVNLEKEVSFIYFQF